MANLLQKTVQRSRWPSISMEDYVSFFSYGGLNYPFTQTYGATSGTTEEADHSFEGLTIAAYKSNGIVFACMLARQLPFSEARLTWQRMKDGRPGEYFGDKSLAILERPWPGGVTADLLSRAIQDVDLGGNFFAARRKGRIKRMRPDWVTIILGSFDDPNTQAGDIDAEVVGFLYHPGGRGSTRPPVALLREEVAHFAPIPDPTASYRGMSWLVPIMREFLSDSAMITHKTKFFENGATPNMVVTLDPSIKKEAFKEWVQMFSEKHEGALNAYKTLYLGAGSTVMPVGKDFKQMDFAVTQAAGESRIAAASGVPGMLVGLSESMKAATFSNYGQARRRLADMTIRPLWRSFASSMEILVRHPDQGVRLWYDDRDIPFLIEDLKDRAEVQAQQAQAMRQLIDAGFVPDTVVDATNAHDWTRLKHTGLFSVQLWAPGENPAQKKTGGTDDEGPGAPNTDDNKPPKAGKPARSEEVLDLEQRERSVAMLLEAALELARMRGDAPPAEPSRAGDVHVHMPENMVRSDVHVDAGTTVERGAVQVDANTTVQEGAFRADAPQVHVDANTTFEEGAVRGGDVTVDPPEFVLQDGAIRAVTEIREGAIRVDAPVTVEGYPMELRDGAIHVEVPVTIERGAVEIDSPVTIERGAVEIDSPVTVERTEVHVDQGAVQIDAPVTVERTEVQVDAPITVERSDVHVDPGAVQISAPVTVERTEVHVDEGAVQVDVAPAELRMEPGAVQVDVSAPVTVEPAQVTIEEGAVRVESPVTIEEGAVRMDAPITVETPEVRMEPHIEVTTPDVQVTIEEGAVRVESPVTIEEGAVRVDAATTIEEGAVEVRVDSPVHIDEGAVQVEAPVTIDRGAVEVTVERDEQPDLSEVTEAVEGLEERVRDLSKPKRKRIVRDGQGRIVEVQEYEEEE